MQDWKSVGLEGCRQDWKSVGLEECRKGVGLECVILWITSDL